MSSLLRTRLCQLHFYSPSWMNGRKDGVTPADSFLQPMGLLLSRQAATPHQALIITEQVFIRVHPALTGHVPLYHTLTAQLPLALTLTDPTAESGTRSRDQSSLVLLEHVPW